LLMNLNSHNTPSVLRSLFHEFHSDKEERLLHLTSLVLGIQGSTTNIENKEPEIWKEIIRELEKCKTDLTGRPFLVVEQDSRLVAGFMETFCQRYDVDAF